MRKSAIGFLILIMFFPLVLLSEEKEIDMFPFAEDYNPERSLIQVIATPQGYERYPIDKMTPYQVWLSNLPLKPKGSPVLSWDGDTLETPDESCGVIDLPITSSVPKNFIALSRVKTTDLGLTRAVASSPFSRPKSKISKIELSTANMPFLCTKFLLSLMENSCPQKRTAFSISGKSSINACL